MKNKNKKAFTLIEILIGVGIAGLGLVGIYALYSMLEKANSAQDETSRLISYLGEVKAIAATNGDFKNINIQYLEDMGINVNRVLGLTEIDGSSGNQVNFIYNGVDSSICSKFASGVYSSGSEFDIVIAGKKIDKDLDPITEITTQCASNGLVDLRFTANVRDFVNSLTDETLIPSFNYNSGNPNSLGSQALTLSQYQAVTGQSQSDVQYGTQGVGFAVAGQPAPVYPPQPEPPEAIVPIVPPAADDDDEEPSSVNLPNETNVVETGLNFTVDNWDKINLYSNGVELEISGLLPSYHYRVEFASTAFNLVKNNPVELVSEDMAIDELFFSEQAQNDGVIKVNENISVDLSDYFRTSLGEINGVKLTNPEEKMNPSLKGFFENSFKNYPVSMTILDEMSGFTVGQTEIRPEVVLPPSTPINVGDELSVQNGCYYDSDNFAVKWISDDLTKKYIIFVHKGQIMKIDDINGQSIVDNYAGWYTTDASQYYYPYTKMPSSMTTAANRYPVLKSAIQTYNMNYNYSGSNGPGHTFLDACYTTPPLVNTDINANLITYTKLRATTAAEKATSGNPEFARIDWVDASVVLPFELKDIRRVTTSLTGQTSNVSLEQKDLKNYTLKIDVPVNNTLTFSNLVTFNAAVVLKNGKRINITSSMTLYNNKSYLTRSQLESNSNYPTCFEVSCYTNPVRPVDGVPGVALPEDVAEIVRKARALGLENLEIKYFTSNPVITPFVHNPSRVSMKNSVGVPYSSWVMDGTLFGWEGYPGSYESAITSAQYSLYEKDTGVFRGVINASWRRGAINEGLELNKYYSFYLSGVVANGKSSGGQPGADITYVICLKGKGTYNGTKVVCQP